MKPIKNRRALRQALVFAALMTGGFSTQTYAATSREPGISAVQYTHQTAPTQFIEVDGARLAYRRFGKTGGIPLVFLQHFVGNLDSWDPKVVDGFARDREVIFSTTQGWPVWVVKCRTTLRTWPDTLPICSRRGV